MNTPLKTLACIGMRLELYPGYLHVQPTGWLGSLFLVQERVLRIQDIREIHLYPGSGLTDGSICIIPDESAGRSIYGMFSRRFLGTAEAFYETLDDLVHPKDVLSALRAIEAS